MPSHRRARTPNPKANSPRRRSNNPPATTKVVSLGVDSPGRRALGLSNLNISWERRPATKDEADSLYVSKINPDLLDPLPSFKRSAKVPETIRSLHERNPELCRELMANRPRFSDPTIKSFWGHLEAAWEDAILGYSWRWPEKDAPYRVEMTEDDIQSILAKCKWIRSLRM